MIGAGAGHRDGPRGGGGGPHHSRVRPRSPEAVRVNKDGVKVRPRGPAVGVITVEVVSLRAHEGGRCH